MAVSQAPGAERFASAPLPRFDHDQAFHSGLYGNRIHFPPFNRILEHMFVFANRTNYKIYLL
jgi:hypothetical protein